MTSSFVNDTEESTDPVTAVPPLPGAIRSAIRAHGMVREGAVRYLWSLLLTTDEPLSVTEIRANLERSMGIRSTKATRCYVKVLDSAHAVRHADVRGDSRARTYIGLRPAQLTVAELNALERWARLSPGDAGSCARKRISGRYGLKQAAHIVAMPWPDEAERTLRADGLISMARSRMLWSILLTADDPMTIR